ncbi:MAG: xanthine dehydrogenase family protein subunit M [Pseudomonadota bacterium]
MTQFSAPTTVADAVACLKGANGAGKILAGGTDLLVQLRAGFIDPSHIVDIKNIQQTRAVVAHDGGYRIGSAVSGAELGEHDEIPLLWPGVVEGLELIGSTQIQGRASLGGNLCNASPAADSVPAMIAARATCEIAGPSGTRELPVEQVVTAPGKTSLAPGEFVVSFFLPPRDPRSSDAYLRFIPRTEMDIAVVGAAVNLTLDASGLVSEAHVALGAVAPTARLVPDAAAAIVGTKLEDEAQAKLQAAASAACDPINDKRGTIEYRTKVAGVLAKRAAAIAYARAGGQ